MAEPWFICGFGCICSHSPPARLGPAAWVPLSQWTLVTWALGLREGGYTEAWTQENLVLAQALPSHLPQAGSLLLGPWAPGITGQAGVRAQSKGTNHTRVRSSRVTES